MSAPVFMHGTIKPDGTLELNQNPNLPPGPVLVTVQPAAGGTSLPGLADVIDAIRQRQQSRGFPGRSAQEIDAGLREGDDDYEQYLQVLRSQTGAGPLAGGS